MLLQASATPLQRAAAEGHVDIVHQLLKHGADVNHQDAVVSFFLSFQKMDTTRYIIEDPAVLRSLRSITCALFSSA